MTPADDEVHLWGVPLAQDDEVVRRLGALLDPGERARLARFAGPHARKSYAVSHGALRLVLAGCLGTDPAALRYEVGRWGKPSLPGPRPAVQFNLSHSADRAMIAVSLDRPVGVDVLRVNPRWRDAPPARYLPSGEARAVAGASPEARAGLVARLLTRKEACVKASGGRLLGLGLRLRTPDGGGTLVVHPDGMTSGCWWLRDLPAPASYGAAVALVGCSSANAVFRESAGWAMD